MLEELLKSGGKELISQLGSQFNLDASQANQVAEVSSETIKNELFDEAKSGNFDGILSLFNGSTSSAGSALSGKLTNSLVGSLLSKVGLKNEMAQKVATFVIPFILQKISGNKPSGGFSAGDLTSLLGGSTTDILKDKASNLLKGGLGGLFK
jgi:hypothetical protein